MKKIIVVGSINTDLVIKAPYIPQKGETLTGSGFFHGKRRQGRKPSDCGGALGRRRLYVRRCG